MNTVCLNGEFRDAAEVAIAPSDAGFLLGDGIFETIRVEQGQLLFAREHFARLARGARVLEIPFHLDVDALLALCQQTLDSNELRNARLRLTLTRGPIKGAPVSAQEGEPTLLITTARLDPHLAGLRERGWRAALSPIPRNHRSLLARIKSTSYAENLLARRLALKSGADGALLLNTDGYIAEADMANIFIIRDNLLLTPPIEDGALPGILRHQALSLAGLVGLEAREETLALQDLLASEEAFLTNAIQLIMPLVLVGGEVIGTGRPGPITLRLFETLRARIDATLNTYS